MLLFVGLGNPGARYAFNRHNIGFMAIDAIADMHAFPSEIKRFDGLLRDGTLEDERVLTFKPTTFMNDSGRAVAQAMHFFKLELSELTVFHDEVDLERGKMRVKQGGGAAGHNGIRSITDHLGPDFRRVRLGVGHPGDRARMTDHVLGDFSKEERKSFLPPFLAAIAAASPTLAQGRADAFMSKVADEIRRLKEDEAGNGV